jgi:hypothetical protein
MFRVAFKRIINISSSGQCRRVCTIRLLFPNNISILRNMRTFLLLGAFVA